MSPEASPLLEIRDLHVAFATAHGTVNAVNGVNLVMHRSEAVGLVGESGSGKTQTALSILRLIDPPGQIVRGQIVFEGRDILSLNEEELRQLRGGAIGFIFQNPRAALNPLIKIGDQIANVYRAHAAVSRRDAACRAIEMLGAVRLPDPARIAASYVHELSGGMAQRAMLALGLVCSPRLVIADEPTTGLDVTVQLQILNLMRSLIRENGASFLLITHDLGIVAHYCQRVAVMHEGHIVEAAEVRDLFHAPQHAYTRRLVSATRVSGGVGERLASSQRR